MLILGTVFVLGAAMLVAYALLQERDVTESGPAELQSPVTFAPVRSATDGPCGPDRLENPSDGRCLEVGSGMTVRRVEEIRVQPPGGGRRGFTVAIAFTAQDARTFATMTTTAARREPPGNRIAVIAEGRVLSSPIVTSPITGGEIQITGPAGRFTKDYTEDLVRRITGD